MVPRHILKLQPAFALWQDCGSKSFQTVVSANAVSSCTHGKAKGQESASPAGSLIAKQQQIWTPRLSATPGIFWNINSRLLNGSREISSSNGTTPLGGKLFLRSAVKIYVCWMSYDLISQGMRKSSSRPGHKSTEFQFIHSCANAEA